MILGTFLVLTLTHCSLSLLPPKAVPHILIEAAAFSPSHFELRNEGESENMAFLMRTLDSAQEQSEERLPDLYHVGIASFRDSDEASCCDVVFFFVLSLAADLCCQ